MDYEAEFLRSIPLFLRRLEPLGPDRKPSRREAQAARDDPAIVSIDDHRPASIRNPGPAQSAPAPAPALAPIPAPALAPALAQTAPEDRDAAFQVTLPRSVIRQIRLRAADEGTTHRAIVLQSLRIAGLTIPEGAEVDRRTLAAQRREQARRARGPGQVAPRPRHARG